MKKLILILLLATVFAESPAVRVKDISTVSGVRTNQLMGVGLVVGLKGTGDSSLVFTNKALTNLLTNLGASGQKDFYKSKNVAAVMVTAELPAFAKPGQKIDAVVSSIGDATSLKDGTVLMTPLKGADDKVYAVCQGQVVVAKSTIKNKKNETVSRIVGGAIIEESVKMDYIEKNSISLSLSNPDFTTSTRIAQALDRGGFAGAKAVDPATIEIPLTPDDKNDIVAFISKLEDFLVIPDSVAKVVVNQRTGTVVIGENVRLAPVAISHGDVEINIKPDVAEDSDETGLTAPVEVAAAQDVITSENGEVVGQAEQVRNVRLVQLKAGATLSALVKALNAVGTSPEDLVAIIQALKTAGSLTAEVEVI